MSNVFSFNRLRNYFRYDLKTLQGNIGMMVLLLGLAPVIIYVFYMLFGSLFSGELLTGAHMHGPALGVRGGFFITTTLVFAILFPSRAYGFLTEKKAGSSWLMLPASRGEKFVSMLLNSLVIVPAVFFLLYFCSDWLVCLLDRTCGNALLTMRLNGQDGLIRGDDTLILVANGFWILYALFAEYVAIFLLGGLLFRKWKIVGTIAALFLLGTVSSTIIGGAFAHFDIVSFGERLSGWVSRHADSINFWLNAFIDLKVGLVLAACGTGIWFRLKTLKH